jgi:hypothetical protein
MCIVLLPPGGNPIAVNKYVIFIKYDIWLFFENLFGKFKFS